MFHPPVFRSRSDNPPHGRGFPPPPDESEFEAMLAALSAPRPLTAFKTSYLEVKVATGADLSDGSALLAGRFRGLAHPVPYSSKSSAVCAKGHDHAPPDETCDCGFYAVRSRDQILAHRFPGAHLADDSNLLTVWLYGEVIEGPKGFRASRQQVVTAETNPFCSAPGCDSSSAGITIASPPVAFDTDGTWFRLSSRCEEHSSGSFLNTAQLTSLFGVEVVTGDENAWRSSREPNISQAASGSLLNRLALFSPGQASPAERTLVVVAVFVLAFLGWALTSARPDLDDSVWAGVSTLFFYLPLVLVAAAGLSRVLDPSVRPVPPVTSSGAWTSTLLIGLVFGLIFLNLGAASTRPAERAVSGSPHLAFNQAAAAIGSVLEGDLAQVDFDAGVLVDLIGPGSPAAAEPATFSDGAGVIMSTDGVPVTVEVFGDRVVLSVLAADRCVHRGLNASGATVFEAHSPLSVSGCVFRPGADTTVVTPPAPPPPLTPRSSLRTPT